jgi:hypothetical protein
MPQSSIRFIALFVVLVLTGCLGGSNSSAFERQAVRQGAPAERGSKACPPHRGSDHPRPQGRDATPAEKETFFATFRKSPTGRTIVDQFSISMAQGTAKRQNTTRHSHDSQHGNQVSFSASDGHTYLWYPGNAAVLKGEWRACEDRFGVTVKGAETVMIPFGKICFKFGPETYNPVTGSQGDKWECAAASKLEERIVEQRRGDVFGLAKRLAVPFVLAREKTTIDQLLAQMPKDR